MMFKKKSHRIVIVALVCVLALSLTGCWDQHELNKLFIVTGVAMDKSATPGQIDITLQVAKSQQSASGSSGDTKSQGDSTILLKSKTIQWQAALRQ
jgi:spore germination protein KC